MWDTSSTRHISSTGYCPLLSRMTSYFSGLEVLSRRWPLFYYVTLPPGRVQFFSEGSYFFLKGQFFAAWTGVCHSTHFSRLLSPPVIDETGPKSMSVKSKEGHLDGSETLPSVRSHPFGDDQSAEGNFGGFRPTELNINTKSGILGFPYKRNTLVF